MSLQETMIMLGGGLMLGLAVLAGLAWVMSLGGDRRSPSDRDVERALRKWREGR